MGEEYLEKPPMEGQEISHKIAAELAEKLKSLACIECTKGWIASYEGKDPLKDIANCTELGLITDELAKRLSDEVQLIQAKVE